MIFDFDFDKVQEAQDFKQIPAGGYVVRVVDVVLNLEKKNLKVVMDYAEGEFSGYGENVEERTGKTWGYVTGYISWRTPAAQGMLKRTVRYFDESNPGKNILEQFKHENFNVLIGSMIGVVMGQEEYRNQKGDVRTKLSLPNFALIKDIHSGNFKVPAFKPLQDNDNDLIPGSTPIADDDKIPF